MPSTFMGLEIGRRGLMSHQQALHTTGHNISNADNREFSRQRVIITSADPLYVPSLNRANTPGNIGQGSVVQSVERIRDNFIDDRIMVEQNNLGYWNIRNGFIQQVEMVYNEPSEDSIRGRLDELWRAWQELSVHPEERSTREVVVEKGVALTNEIRHVSQQLRDLRDNANNQVAHRVERINTLAQNIRDLNERIMKSQALGDNPNDLMDRRDGMIEQLSNIVDISVSRSDSDEIIVYIGQENLIQGEIVHRLEAVIDPENSNMYRVVWEGTNNGIHNAGGELGALIDVRDHIIRENINDVNAFAVNLVDLTNEVHRDGFGRQGETNVDFFEYTPITDNVDGNYDLNNDGVTDVTAIFRVTGNNAIDASAAIGVAGTLTFVTNDEREQQVQVDYNANDTVMTVLQRINNAHLGVVAYINHNSQLAVKATVAQDSDSRNFMIRHLEDSGQFLVGLTGILAQSGPQGAFDYHRVDDIRKFLPTGEHITITPQLNPGEHIFVSAGIRNNIDRIAAAQGVDVGGTGDSNESNGIGDGTNALRLARLRHINGMVDQSTTFNDFLVSLISKIGTQGEEAEDRVRSQETLLTNLQNLRQSVSGVNMDEEMANMVAFQHGYNASARVISMIDRMLETIINLGRG